ncbi:IS66-like element accessory protein TnpA [Variovorax sp. LjRoot178]|uniref:IS66-like element accessory protein TnpA n=1 Tax=Variovorax sp. LjRoot178 TaxID=3342277 RepID=UPI003ECF5B40
MPAAFVGGRRRRRHSDEFKASAVAACQQPGISMAAVAMAHGINANLLRRWVREGEMQPNVAVDDKHSVDAAALAGPAFVPMTVPPAVSTADIRIELRRGAMSVVVTWPASAATECAAWIRELLR